MAAVAKERYHSWLHRSEDSELLAEEAVAMARRLGDPAVLAETLIAHHDMVWFPGREQERLDIAVELERVARDIGDEEQATEAVLLQAVVLLELGDSNARGRLTQFVERAEKLPHPRFAYLAATRRATLGMIAGDIPGIEAALASAEAIAAEHGEPDHDNVSAAEFFTLGILTGDRRASAERARAPTSSTAPTSN